MHRYQMMAARADGRAAGYAFKCAEAYLDGNLRMARYWTACALEDSRAAGEWAGMYYQFGGES